MHIRTFGQGEILRASGSTRQLGCPLKKFCAEDLNLGWKDWHWQPLDRPIEYTVWSMMMDVTALTVWIEKLAAGHDATDVVYRVEPCEREYFPVGAQEWGIPPGATAVCIFIILDDPQSRHRQERQTRPEQNYGRQYAMIAFRSDQGYGMILHTSGDCITMQTRQLGAAVILQTFEIPPGDGIWVWEGEPVGRPGAAANYSNGEWRRPNHWEWQQLQLGEDPFNLGQFWLPLTHDEMVGEFSAIGQIRNHLLRGMMRWFRAPDR